MYRISAANILTCFASGSFRIEEVAVGFEGVGAPHGLGVVRTQGTLAPERLQTYNYIYLYLLKHGNNTNL